MFKKKTYEFNVLFLRDKHLFCVYIFKVNGNCKKCQCLDFHERYWNFFTLLEIFVYNKHVLKKYGTKYQQIENQIQRLLLILVTNIEKSIAFCPLLKILSVFKFFSLLGNIIYNL